MKMLAEHIERGPMARSSLSRRRSSPRRAPRPAAIRGFNRMAARLPNARRWSPDWPTRSAWRASVGLPRAWRTRSTIRSAVCSTPSTRSRCTAAGAGSRGATIDLLDRGPQGHSRCGALGAVTYRADREERATSAADIDDLAPHSPEARRRGVLWSGERTARPGCLAGLSRPADGPQSPPQCLPGGAAGLRAAVSIVGNGGRDRADRSRIPVPGMPAAAVAMLTGDAAAGADRRRHRAWPSGWPRNVARTRRTFRSSERRSAAARR